VAALRNKLEQWSRAARRDAVAVYLATRDPRLPVPAKLIAAVTVAYALSPIDLIPDFIPVLGLLDDLVLLPLAVWAVERLVGPELMAEHRRAAIRLAERPQSLWGAALIVLLWLGAAALLVSALGRVVWAAST
jgi:uncharacterized membrane protein YkvA (DUF1232 family)